MFNIGPGELIVILILALVLLGPEKLPEVARAVGKGMRDLRRATEDLKDQVESEFYKLDDTRPRPPTLRAPPGPRMAANAPPALPAPAPAPEPPAAAEPPSVDTITGAASVDAPGEPKGS